MGAICIQYGDERHIYACMDDEEDWSYSSSTLDHRMHTRQRSDADNNDENCAQNTNNNVPGGTTHGTDSEVADTNLTGGVEVDPDRVSPARAEVGPGREPTPPSNHSPFDQPPFN